MNESVRSHSKGTISYGGASFYFYLYARIKGAISENRSCVNFIAINQEKGKTHGEKEQYVPGRTVNHAE